MEAADDEGRGKAMKATVSEIRKFLFEDMPRFQEDIFCAVLTFVPLYIGAKAPREPGSYLHYSTLKDALGEETWEAILDLHTTVDNLAHAFYCGHGLPGMSAQEYDLNRYRDIILVVTEKLREAFPEAGI